ncbi:MAG: class I SAM-dependent methyltransferase [Acidobacteria bacterium]|nr:class I SAM-dependent methyltransferase [Acidobacteriota bacterium]
MSEGDGYAGIEEFYDYTIPYRDRQDVHFYVDEALRAGGPVLEVGCGTGRVLIPVARAGAVITGLDASDAMLSVCRKKLECEPEEIRRNVRLVYGDMRSFDLGTVFSLVTVPFRPFQHLLTVEDQLACLAALRRHLAPEGRLILDLFNPSLQFLGDPKTLETPLEEPPFEMPDGRRVLRRIRILSRDLYKQVQQIVIEHEVTGPDGVNIHRSGPLTLRYIFRYEIEHLLARAGFELETVYADYDRSPYGSKYPGDLICLARRT